MSKVLSASDKMEAWWRQKLNAATTLIAVEFFREPELNIACKSAGCPPYFVPFVSSLHTLNSPAYSAGFWSCGGSFSLVRVLCVALFFSGRIVLVPNLWEDSSLVHGSL